jgi:hypothetical protein
MATRKASTSLPKPAVKKRRSVAKAAAKAPAKAPGNAAAAKVVAAAAPVPAPRPAPSRAPSPEERQHLVRQAAYFIAERRGFVGGNAVEDWLLAEQQVEAMFPATPSAQRRTRSRKG